MRTAFFRGGRLASISLLLAGSSPAAVAHDRPSVRLTPNGVDDTAQLQAALTACSGARPACKISLSKGVFHTDVLLVRDFKGRIQGQGARHTIVRPITGRPLRSTEVPFLEDPTLEEPYPVLLHFADGGDIRLADFTLEFPGEMRVEPYTVVEPIADALLSAIMVDGTETARLVVSGLKIIAAADDARLASFGSNLLNAIRFEGQIRLVADIDTATPLAGGEFIAYDTHIRSAGLGFALRDVTNVDARIVDNHVQDARLIGVFLTDMGNSHARVAGNRISSELVGIQILRGVRPPEEPSSFDVIDNAFAINERGTSLFGPGGGVAFFDVTPDGGIDRASVSHNDIALGVEVFDGVFVLGDRGGVRIGGNRISGPALEAGINIWDSRGTRTRHNRFPGLEPGLADVRLNSGTSECRVIEPEATVLDEGTDNHVEAKTVIKP